MVVHAWGRDAPIANMRTHERDRLNQFLIDTQTRAALFAIWKMTQTSHRQSIHRNIVDLN